jgi:hypothetical protein
MRALLLKANAIDSAVSGWNYRRKERYGDIDRDRLAYIWSWLG